MAYVMNMQDDPPQDDDDAVLDNAPVSVSCSYKNLLKFPKTKKEVVERLLEFFSAFVMLYIGWRVIFWICPWLAPLLTYLFT